MARRTMKVIDIVEVLTHWHAGRRMGELCSSLGIDPKTVRKYTAPAMAAGISPGGPPLSREEWSQLARGWFPELTDDSSRQTTWPEIEAHAELIKSWLGLVTISTIHQRLRDDHGLVASESSLRRYLEANMAEEVKRAQVTVLRETPPPGEEAQVDYGLLGRWVDPATGKVRRVWGFIMVLAFSRLMFVRPVLKMDSRNWVECHVAAFEFLGVARRIVPDNLKTGVVKPDLYDPLINKAFSEMAAHYDCLIDPARALKPKDKARVERPVPYVRDSFFAGRSGEFADLESMQADALRWCRAVGNLRQCRGLDRFSPQAVYDTEERDAMTAVPMLPFEIASWSKVTVRNDIHVKVGKAIYSMPWRLIGQRLDVREGYRVVEAYLDGVLVKTHARIEKGKQTDPADYPPEKIAFSMRSAVWCKKRAEEAGASVAAVIAVLFEVNALYRLRQAQGVIRLGELHGNDRLDAACARALAFGDPSYRTIKGILRAGLENDGADAPQVPEVPAHLHGPLALFEIEGAVS